MLQRKAADYSGEKRYLRKDGSVVWVSLDAHVILAPDGKPARAWATVRDITDRKRAEWLNRDRAAILEMIVKEQSLDDGKPGSCRGRLIGRLITRNRRFFCWMTARFASWVRICRRNGGIR